MSTVKTIKKVRELLEKQGTDPEQFFPSCLGCGYCCLEATCSLGVSLFGAKYPCPSLFWNGEKYRCKLADGREEILYIGTGCCSPLNSWREDVKERRCL